MIPEALAYFRLLRVKGSEPHGFELWAGRDSNPWPPDYQSGALAKLLSQRDLSYRPTETVASGMAIIPLQPRRA